MAVKKSYDKSPRIQGRVQLQGLDGVPQELKLTAYVFDPAGKPAGSAPIDPEGRFTLDVGISAPADVEVFVAPEADPDSIRRVASYRQAFRASDWKRETSGYVIESKPVISEDLVLVWWPRHICVSGHIRKRVVVDGVVKYFPVPFTKVEVFDVDREPCWWPYLVSLKESVRNQLFIRAETLLATEVKPPIPDPEPGPIYFRSATTLATGVEKVGLNPQPEVPSHLATQLSEIMAPVTGMPVGEIAALDPAEARSLERLTIVGDVAPWILFPHCCYSRRELCETFTDCNGYFRCCFNWWPIHLRHGRLRFDSLPDIILRVTQVIDGVKKVIYMDPYSSTRWNSGSTHVDLFLDDEQVIHGTGCTPEPDLDECDATLLQLGRDELWKIDKANGLYAAGGETNGAYGFSLVVRGDFNADMKDGSPKRYYLLSYAKATSGGGVPDDSAFKPVQTTLEAYRSAPGGIFSSYLLGPQPVGSGPGLYEIQDTAHWWIPKNMPLSTPGNMVLGLWPTRDFEANQGTYWLRLEVFDQNGVKLSGTKFCNHQGDGSGLPVTPTTSDGKLDVKVHVDNALMTFGLVTPATNRCGVVPWVENLNLLFTVNASQPHGRVHRWQLTFNKGVSPTEHLVNKSAPSPEGSQRKYPHGTVGPVSETFAGTELKANELGSTCAYGLHLYAWSHVRVNYGWHDYGRKSYAIAVEKCS